MTQPDLVSKLREVTKRIEKFADQRDRESNPCSAQDIRACALLLRESLRESLLRLEGQVAPPAYVVSERKDTGNANPCGPSQPETVREGYKGICVCGHRSGAHHESDPSCEFCACKSYRDVSAWGAFSSTPIVPSTPDDPRFDGVVVEVAEEFAILEEDIPALRRILARIRKDALEEAARYIEKSVYSRVGGTLPAAIRALAERPAPAGEVTGANDAK